jgi:hypothetical protein
MQQRGGAVEIMLDLRLARIGKGHRAQLCMLGHVAQDMFMRDYFRK